MNECFIVQYIKTKYQAQLEFRLLQSLFIK